MPLPIAPMATVPTCMPMRQSSSILCLAFSNIRVGELGSTSAARNASAARMRPRADVGIGAVPVGKDAVADELVDRRAILRKDGVAIRVPFTKQVGHLIGRKLRAHLREALEVGHEQRHLDALRGRRSGKRDHRLGAQRWVMRRDNLALLENQHRVAELDAVAVAQHARGCQRDIVDIAAIGAAEIDQPIIHAFAPDRRMLARDAGIAEADRHALRCVRSA